MMKLLATSGTLLSLGLCATVSFAQGIQERSEVGNRYDTVRSAYRLRFQDEEMPVPDDAAEAAQEMAEAAKDVANDEVSEAADHHVIGEGAEIHAQPAQAHTLIPQGIQHHGHAVAAPCATGDCGTGSCGTGTSGNIYPTQIYNHAGSCSTGSCGTGNCSTGSCGTGWNDGLVYTGGCGSCWYSGMTGLLMAREDDSGTNLSYNTNAPAASLLSTKNQNQDDYEGGFEVMLGRRLNDCYSVEGSYWGIFPDVAQFDVYQSDLGGGNLYSSLGYDGLSINGQGVQQWFGNATQTAVAHRLRRSYEVHNAEFNLIRNASRGCGSYNFELLAGLRYLKINDGFDFRSDYANSTFGDDPFNETAYGVDVDNDLFGFQVGGRGEYYLNQCWAVNAGAKFGIYNNRIDHRQNIQNGFGYATNGTSDYNIDSSDEDIAFLGELSTGLSYDFWCNWRATVGYRVIAATGIATADGQIPQDRDFAYPSNHIDSNDSFILHGGYFGLEYCW